MATNDYIPLRSVNVTEAANIKLKNIKQERSTYYPPKPVKLEPGIHMRRRVNPSDRERPWKFVHVSGRPCNQDGDQDCNSQSENEDNADELNNESLPDLPRIPDLTLTRSNCGNKVISQKDSTTVDLTSPPAVQRRDFMPQTSKSRGTTNLGDLLCTLNFDVQIEKDAPQNEARKVITKPPENIPDRQETYVNTSYSTASRPKGTPTNSGARTVVTPILLDDDDSTASQPPDTPPATGPLTRSSPSGSSPQTDTMNDTEPARQVVTVTTSDSSPQLNPTTATDITADKSIDGKDLNALLSSEDSNQTRASTALTSTPHSVITDPDAVELETANAMLQLGSVGDSNNKHQDDLDAAYDNSSLLPVDAAPLADCARELAESNTLPDQNIDKNNNIIQDDDENTDSDKTIDYTPGPLEKDTTTITSPKGSLKYKQYGIKRPSPKTGPNRNRRCPYCGEICHSKREWNTHHKTEHTKVQCPDCRKLFPTPDALNHHRYVHNESHRFKCDICDKICAFQSDLEQHMSKHDEDKKWFCSYDGCT